MSSPHPAFTELTGWDGRFVLEANEALGLDIPSHDVVLINDRRVFREADEVLNYDMRSYDPKAKYEEGETLSHTEARYGDVIVVMKRSVELPDRFTRELSWTTDQRMAQRFRADIFDRTSDHADGSLWADIVQDRFSTYIPLPFFMLRAARLANRAEEKALELAN